LGRVCLNGDGARVHKNAPRDAVAIPHKKQHNNGRCYEKGESEQPKKTRADESDS
jgi:hypothetical protein